MTSGKGYAPVWLTLGFAVGCLFGWLVFKTRAADPAPGPTTPVRPPKPGVVVTPGRLAEVEMLFETWGGYAVWADDLTEFVAWRKQPGRIEAEYYQAVRVRGRFYFRTLHSLARPLIDHGVIVRCPLAFTETDEMREKYYREHPDETPGRYSLAELMDRAPLLPPRPPEAREGEANRATETTPLAPSAPPPPPPPTEPPPQTVPGDGE